MLSLSLMKDQWARLRLRCVSRFCNLKFAQIQVSLCYKVLPNGLAGRFIKPGKVLVFVKRARELP